MFPEPSGREHRVAVVRQAHRSSRLDRLAALEQALAEGYLRRRSGWELESPRTAILAPDGLVRSDWRQVAGALGRTQQAHILRTAAAVAEERLRAPSAVLVGPQSNTSTAALRDRGTTDEHPRQAVRLVAVRTLQLRSWSSTELARDRRMSLVARWLLLLLVVGMDHRRRARRLLCQCRRGLLLLRWHTAGPAHVVDCHLVVRHRASGVQGNAQGRGAADGRHIRLSSGKRAALGLIRGRCGHSRRLGRLLLLLLLLLLLRSMVGLKLRCLLRGSRPWLRAGASTSCSHTCKALFLVVLLLDRALWHICRLSACPRCDEFWRESDLRSPGTIVRTVLPLSSTGRGEAARAGACIKAAREIGARRHVAGHRRRGEWARCCGGMF